MMSDKQIKQWVDHVPNFKTYILHNYITKTIYFFGLIIIFIIPTILIIPKIFKQQPENFDILLETHYKKVVWEDYGEVFEPIIEIPIYYPEKGFQKEEFLIDSGALVSSLSREKAQPLGFSLAMLPRTTFKSFGNSYIFAYRANILTKLGNEELSIPIVFTEAAETKSILGRMGFFDKYSIYFDSTDQIIQIRN